MGIGTVVSPIRILVTSLQAFLPIFNEGIWSKLTTVGSESYNPFLSNLLLGEIVYNVIMIIITIFLIILFFSRHHLFPKLYILIVLISFFFIPFDSWLVSRAIPNTPVFSSEVISEFLSNIIGGIIWIPYMIYSKRVKVTFIEVFNTKKLDITTS